jgi:hypothetical protein
MVARGVFDVMEFGAGACPARRLRVARAACRREFGAVEVEGIREAAILSRLASPSSLVGEVELVTLDVALIQGLAVDMVGVLVAVDVVGVEPLVAVLVTIALESAVAELGSVEVGVGLPERSLWKRAPASTRRGALSGSIGVIDVLSLEVVASSAVASRDSTRASSSARRRGGGARQRSARPRRLEVADGPREPVQLGDKEGLHLAGIEHGQGAGDVRARPRLRGVDRVLARLARPPHPGRLNVEFIRQR